MLIILIHIPKMLLQEMKINKFVANYSSALLKKLEKENHQLQNSPLWNLKEGAMKPQQFLPLQEGIKLINFSFKFGIIHLFQNVKEIIFSFSSELTILL